MLFLSGPRDGGEELSLEVISTNLSGSDLVSYSRVSGSARNLCGGLDGNGSVNGGVCGIGTSLDTESQKLPVAMS